MSVNKVRSEVCVSDSEEDWARDGSDNNTGLSEHHNNRSKAQPEDSSNLEPTYSRHQRTTPTQFLVMLQFMERHGDIGKLGLDRRSVDPKWRELTAMLNKFETKKPCDRWKKVWADWKNNSWRKWRRIKKNPKTELSLTPWEKRVTAFRCPRDGNEADSGAKKPTLQNGSQAPDSPGAPVVVEDIENPDEIPTYYIIEEGVEDSLSSESISLQASPDPLPQAPEHQTSPQPISITRSPSPIYVPALPSPKPVSPTALTPSVSPAPAPSNQPASPYKRRVITIHKKTQNERQLPHSTTRRRRQCCDHSNDFVALEHRRLRLEEVRARNQHERERERERNIHERETERLKLDATRLELEARRLELHAEETAVMRRMDAFLERRTK